MKSDMNTIKEAATRLHRRLAKCEELSAQERLDALNALAQVQTILNVAEYKRNGYQNEWDD